MWVETPSSGQNISLLLYWKFIFNKNFWPVCIIKKQICSKQILCGDTLDDKNALWEEIDSHVEPMKW